MFLGLTHFMNGEDLQGNHGRCVRSNPENDQWACSTRSEVVQICSRLVEMVVLCVLVPVACHWSLSGYKPASMRRVFQGDATLHDLIVHQYCVKQSEIFQTRTNYIGGLFLKAPAKGFFPKNCCQNHHLIYTTSPTSLTSPASSRSTSSTAHTSFASLISLLYPLHHLHHLHQINFISITDINFKKSTYIIHTSSHTGVVTQELL